MSPPVRTDLAGERAGLAEPVIRAPQTDLSWWLSRPRSNDIQSRWLALSGEVCPLCGNATRQTPDVINELAQVVIDEGGAIHHINSGGAQLRDYDTGADLSFPLPQPPADGDGEGWAGR
jgi:hypothetical protein